MNIDKDIEKLKWFNDGFTFKQCETCSKFNEEDSCCNKEKCEELQAIENVLADRERLINNEMEKIFSDNQIREYQKKHYISKDKIKAKIEEHTRIKNDYMFNELKCHMEVEKGIIKVLEELLEG